MPHALLMGGVAILMAAAPELDSSHREFALDSFHDYAFVAEQRMTADGPFLILASNSATRERLRSGEIVASPAAALGLAAPVPISGGEMQHWVGAAFVPGASLGDALPLLRDYSNRARYMAPEIAESQLLEHSEDAFLVDLKLVEHSIISGTFDARLRIRYRYPDAHRLAIDSRSESVTELASGDGFPARKDRGLLWGLNHYWRIEEADGGLYLECEALVLSRRPPAVLQWIAAPMISQAARKTLAQTIAATRSMIESAVPPDHPELP